MVRASDSELAWQVTTQYPLLFLHSRRNEARRPRVYFCSSTPISMNARMQCAFGSCGRSIALSIKFRLAEMNVAKRHARRIAATLWADWTD